MGQSLSSLQDLGVNPTLITGQSGYYYVKPPSPHYEFEKYLVRVDPKEGVFFIKAIGKDLDDSGFGIETKSHFSDIRSMVDSVYGSSELTDILFPGSIWDEFDDWMMGLRKNERYYIAHWENADGSVFSGNIEKIYLGANALSSSTGYVSLEYYGTKHSELSEKAKKVSAQVF